MGIHESLVQLAEYPKLILVKDAINVKKRSLWPSWNAPPMPMPIWSSNSKRRLEINKSSSFLKCCAVKIAFVGIGDVGRMIILEY